jgi:hypothetical protein
MYNKLFSNLRSAACMQENAHCAMHDQVNFAKGARLAAKLTATKEPALLCRLPQLHA